MPTRSGLNHGWPRRGAYSDDRFSIQLRADSEMLGNENHMVLLIENLVNNALFYSQQKAAQKPLSAASRSRWRKRDGEVEFRVYNRGPHIDEDEKDKIYQLGFSSRRVREHHGKGLGLYFVDQIVRGFEGSIEFDNIENEADRWCLASSSTTANCRPPRSKFSMGTATPVPGRRFRRRGRQARRMVLRGPIASIEVAAAARASRS